MRKRTDPNEVILEPDHARIQLYDQDQNVKGEVLIDLEDVRRCSYIKWSLDDHGYARTQVRGQRGVHVRLHRFLLGLTNPEILVDHRNRVRLDCRKDNLRVCGRFGSAMNRKRPFVLKSTLVSRFKGVDWNHDSWRARIAVKGTALHLGYFGSEVEVAKVFNKAAIKYHGEFAVLNAVLNDV